MVVYTTGGEVLLLKRTDHPDFWQSVTGSLHWDETPVAAARRELGEETGLACGEGLVDWHRSVEFEILARWRHRFAPGITHNREHLFSLELEAPAPVRLDEREHAAHAWTARRRALETVCSWSNRRAIEDVVPI